MNKNNAQQAIVLEAVALALALDSDPEVKHLSSVASLEDTLTSRLAFPEGRTASCCAVCVSRCTDTRFKGNSVPCAQRN